MPRFSPDLLCPSRLNLQKRRSARSSPQELENEETGSSGELREDLAGQDPLGKTSLGKTSLGMKLRRTPAKTRFAAALVWVVLALAAASSTAALNYYRLSGSFDADARTLHRILSQRADQHDAHLTSLAALHQSHRGQTDAPSCRIPPCQISIAARSDRSKRCFAATSPPFSQHAGG